MVVMLSVCRKEAAEPEQPAPEDGEGAEQEPEQPAADSEQPGAYWLSDGIDTSSVS